MKPPPGEAREQAQLPEYARKTVQPKEADTKGARATNEGRIAWANAGWVVVGASILLAVLGIYSISVAAGLSAGAGAAIVKKQTLFLLMGICACGVVAVPDYRRVLPHLVPGALVTVGLLVFLLIPFVPEFLVTPRNGARRWIDLGLMDFQPSELAKVVYVLVMAAYLRWRKDHRTIFGLAGPAVLTFIPMTLILVEPDLGTALLFMPTLFVMLIAAGAKLVHLCSTLALGGVFAGVIVVFSLVFAQVEKYPLLRPHQVERIQAVLDVYTGNELFADSRGFQAKQASMLIGAGGVNGHPPDRARALVHFSSLPERHNDMIFAVIVNRFGLLGSLVLLGLYGAWCLGGLVAAGHCKDPFGRLIIVGFVGLIATQASINMGMTLGLLPITGMTLPYVSYGGSSLLMGFLMTGVILNVALRRPEKLWRESFEFGKQRG